MPKAGTPQTPPQAPKPGPNDTTLGGPEKAPEIKSAALPIESQGSVADPILEAEKFAKEIQGSNLGAPTFDDAPHTADPEPIQMIAGTPANPKTLPLPPGDVRSYALIRSGDGMWRSVQYTIRGNQVVQVRTKEPDMKAILAAQITDALALDMPLFNDEDDQQRA